MLDMKGLKWLQTLREAEFELVFLVVVVLHGRTSDSVYSRSDGWLEKHQCLTSWGWADE